MSTEFKEIFHHFSYCLYAHLLICLSEQIWKKNGIGMFICRRRVQKCLSHIKCMAYSILKLRISKYSFNFKSKTPQCLCTIYHNVWYFPLKLALEMQLSLSSPWTFFSDAVTIRELFNSPTSVSSFVNGDNIGTHLQVWGNKIDHANSRLALFLA